MKRRQANGNSGKHDVEPSSSSSSPLSLSLVSVVGSRRRCLQFCFFFMVAALAMLNIFQIPSITITIIDQELSSPAWDRPTTKAVTTVTNPTVSAAAVMTVRVAYVISITHCNWELIEAAAIHGHSIDLAHYHYNNYTVSSSTNNKSNNLMLRSSHVRYAMVHPDAESCLPILRDVLRYETQLREVPLSLNSIKSRFLRRTIDADNSGCCGAKELLKLYAYALDEEQHDVVIHLDTDVLVFQPPWHAISAMLINDDDDDNHRHHHPIWSQTEPPRRPRQQRPSSSHRPSFFFTRDYLQASSLHHDPDKFAIQGGMFILRPNRTVFDDLIATIQNAKYTSQSGWGLQGFGGYWGAPQVQGLLSYYYYIPEQLGTAVELNRCYYNNMGAEPHRWFNVSRKAKYNGQCTNMQPTCQDCRKVSLSDIIFVHYTMCSKPWKCLRSVVPDSTNLCYALHQAWFQVRESLELQQDPATRILWPILQQNRQVDRPFWTNATLSYCTNPHVVGIDTHTNNNNNSTKKKKDKHADDVTYRPKRGKYHPLVLLNLSSSWSINLIPQLAPSKSRHGNKTKK